MENIQTENRPCWKRGDVQKVLWVAICAEIGYATLNYSTMPVYLRDDRHFGEAVIALVFVSFLVFETALKPLMGHAADKYGSRKLMIAGPAISIVTTILSLAWPRTGGAPLEVLGFIVLRMFDGLAVAMIWPALYGHMNAIVQDRERQSSMSYLNACYMIGIAMAYPLGGIVNDLFRFTGAALVLAALLFLAATFIARGMPKVASPAPEQSEHSVGGVAGFFDTLKQIPEYLVVAVVTFIGVGFPLAIFKLFATKQFELSETQFGGLILPGALAMAFASGPMAKIGERIGSSRSVHLGLGLCASGMTLIALGAFLPMFRTPWAFALGGLPLGIGFLLAIPAWMTSVSNINPAKRSTNIGAVMTAQGVGAIIGAAIGGPMYEKLQPVGKALGLSEAFGRYTPFIGCAVCITLGFVLSLHVLRDRDVASTAPGATTPDLAVAAENLLCSDDPSVPSKITPIAGERPTTAPLPSFQEIPLAEVSDHQTPSDR